MFVSKVPLMLTKSTRGSSSARAGKGVAGVAIVTDLKLIARSSVSIGLWLNKRVGTSLHQPVLSGSFEGAVRSV